MPRDVWEGGGQTRGTFELRPLHRPVPCFAPFPFPDHVVCAAAAAGPQACQNEFASFQDCLKNSNGDIAPCQFYMDMLNQCKKTYTA